MVNLYTLQLYRSQRRLFAYPTIRSESMVIFKVLRSGLSDRTGICPCIPDRGYREDDHSEQS